MHLLIGGVLLPSLQIQTDFRLLFLASQVSQTYIEKQTVKTNQKKC